MIEAIIVSTLIKIILILVSAILGLYFINSGTKAQIKLVEEKIKLNEILIAGFDSYKQIKS